MLEFVQLHKVKNIIYFKVVEVNIILCHNSTFLYFHKKKITLWGKKDTLWELLEPHYFRSYYRETCIPKNEMLGTNEHLNLGKLIENKITETHMTIINDK